MKIAQHAMGLSLLEQLLVLTVVFALLVLSVNTFRQYDHQLKLEQSTLDQTRAHPFQNMLHHFKHQHENPS